MRGRVHMRLPTSLDEPRVAVFVAVALALVAAPPSGSARASSLCRAVSVGGAPIDLLGRPCRADRRERHLAFPAPVELRGGSEFTTGLIGPFTTGTAGPFTTDLLMRAPRELPPTGLPVGAQRPGQRH
jgi:hypothetical protein